MKGVEREGEERKTCACRVASLVRLVTPLPFVSLANEVHQPITNP